MISRNSFFCSEKVFVLISIWMIGERLMKQHYLRKKNFIATGIWKKLQMQIICMEKESVKIFK